MVWVFVFVAIGLAGLVVLICYGVWLAHKAADLFSEVEMLGRRAEELADLLARIEWPAPAPEWSAAAGVPDQLPDERPDGRPDRRPGAATGRLSVRTASAGAGRRRMSEDPRLDPEDLL